VSTRNSCVCTGPIVMADASSDEERAELTLRGLRMIRDAALEDGKAITAEYFDKLIVALETGGHHPLLQWWLDHKQAP
jgi:hypothetical protein